MLDTNMMDAHPKSADPNHNICGALHNPPGASCSATGGPKNLDDCFKFMWVPRLKTCIALLRLKHEGTQIYDQNYSLREKI